MSNLPTFPQLIQSEFIASVTALQHRFSQHEQDQHEWTSVEVIERYDTRYLQITRPLGTRSSAPPTSEESDTNEAEVIDEEEDDQALPHPPAPRPQILYDILLSPTYQVPTLYVHIADLQHRFPPTLETLYAHIIPPHYAAQTKDVGVIGGITIIDHPIHNRPVFFIHPCRTAEVMEAVVGGREVTAEEYLMLWIGAMGASVGLDVSLGLAESGGDDVKKMTR